MERRFENQIAVISGAADGLGKGLADRIAAEGGHVALFDIDNDLLKKAKASLTSKGLKASMHVVDISNECDVQQAFNNVIHRFGKVDIMVNSAGIVGPTNTSIIDYDLTEFDRIYSINLRGAFLMTKYAIKAMEVNNYGRILLMASIAGKEGNPFMVGYSSMKAGVIGLVKSIGKEYATSGITINGLAPALIKTRMNDNTSPEQLAYMTSKIPMNRLGTIEEVAAISSWIVSKESSFSTGFVFDISGGRATY